MASLIRECLLDADNKPIPPRIKRVNTAIRDAFPDGCPVRIQGGKRKGQQCGRTMFCNAYGTIGCGRVRAHATDACEPPYASVVFSVINDIEKNGDESSARLEEQARERVAAEEEKYRRDFVIRMAKQEAKRRDVEFVEKTEVHARPDGKAPTGKTWSYLDGAWISKKRKAEEGGAAAPKKTKI